MKKNNHNHTVYAGDFDKAIIKPNFFLLVWPNRLILVRILCSFSRLSTVEDEEIHGARDHFSVDNTTSKGRPNRRICGR